MFMTKDDLRNADYDLSSWSDAMHWFSSSGTTGSPVLYPWTCADEEHALRTLERVHSADGRAPGCTAFIIAPTGLPSMWAHMDRQLRFLEYATVFPGVDSPHRVINLLQSIKPRLLMSLPLVLTRLGELWQFLVNDRSSHPSMIFVAGDVLSPARRARLSSIWQAEVHNFYGMSEIFGPLAHEADKVGVLSWQTPEVRVEILDPVTHENISEGHVGVGVYTTLWERPARLVRYWTGDFLQLVEWIEPGQPRFIVKGRQGISLPRLRKGYFPVDIDDILLSDPALGNEWTVEMHTNSAVILCESSNSIEVVDPHTLDCLQACFSAPFRLEVVTPGSLDRSLVKLGLLEQGYTQE